MRKLFALLAAVALACGLTLATSSPASATGAWLGCRISPGTVLSYNQFCTNGATNASWYTASFLVQNAPTPLSYTWELPPYNSIYDGCGSSDNFCELVTHGGDDIIVYVALNYIDHSEGYYTAEALLEYTECCP